MDSFDRGTRSVAVVVPALDEERTIRGVLDACREASLPTRVIAVINGSSDSSADVARSVSGVEVHELSSAGKGEAMWWAIDHVVGDADIVLFLDADLRGLTGDQVDQLIAPVLNDEARMSCGILCGRFWRKALHDAPFFCRVPTLTGQRCLGVEDFRAIPRSDCSGYRVEATMNRFFTARRHPVVRVPLDRVDHVRKEDKGPRVRGKLSKYRMIVSVYAMYTRLVLRQWTRPRATS